MVTPPRLVSATLLVIGLLLIGCDGGDPEGGSCGGGYGDFSHVVPKHWIVISQKPVNIPGENEMCVVLYQVDVSSSGQHTPAVAGIVYALGTGEPPNIYAYPLNLPEGFYLGEHQLGVRAEKALTGLQDKQLIIEDMTPEQIVVEASIFSWEKADKPENSAYKLRGWFRADEGVSVEVDRVTVRERIKDTRSQLAYQRVYKSRENKSYFEAGSQDLVDPETEVISLAAPDDPATARFPEKVVLEFYQHITDTQAIVPLLIHTPLTKLTALLNNQYGCNGVDRNQIARAWVEDIDWPHNADIKPEVTVKKGKCQLKDGSVKEFANITWQLERNEGQWRLAGTK